MLGVGLLPRESRQKPTDKVHARRAFVLLKGTCRILSTCEELVNQTKATIFVRGNSCRSEGALPADWWKHLAALHDTDNFGPVDALMAVGRRLVNQLWRIDRSGHSISGCLNDMVRFAPVRRP